MKYLKQVFGGNLQQYTMVLALVVLVSFILYYFVNWKYLSSLWGMA